MPEQPLLEITGITKTFPGVVALNEVNFDVRRGEVHVLLGENGAGKSTLMKVLAGVYRPDSGEMRLRGRHIELRSPKDAQEHGIGMIHQEFNLVPYLSVAANIFLGREPVRGGLIDFNTMNESAAELLERLSLSLDPRTLVNDLGVAQRQMVEVAKALALDADILIMDEPTAALTREEVNQLFLTIDQLRQRGVTIIYISHRLEEIKVVGDRVTVLRNGIVAGTGSVAELTVDDLVRMMVGRELEALYTRNFSTPERTEPMVKVSGLTRRGVLDDINLEIYPGEIVGLAGVVGAGRTEVARAIYGIDPIDSGQVIVLGQDITGWETNRIADLGVGFLPEDRKEQGLALERTVRDNIVISSLRQMFPHGLVDQRDEQRAAEHQRDDLAIATPTVTTPAGALSGGNQQKVIIGRWLLRGCRFLIFDEPTRGVDVGAKGEVHRLMDDMVQDGGAVLLISSDLPEVVQMSDRIYVMREGRIVAHMTRDEIDAERVIAYATGGA